MRKLKYCHTLLVFILTGVPCPMAKALEIYAHRGFAGLYPENTLMSFEQSLKLGVTTLDVDVAMTKDEVIVASHDPFLNHEFTSKNGTWLDNNDIKIPELTFEELQHYEVGKMKPASNYSKKFPNKQCFELVKIPSLQQVIDLIKKHGHDKHRIEIEVKTTPADSKVYVEKFVAKIIETLQKNHFVAKAEIQSFDWRTLLHAKKIEPNITVSFITEQSKSFDTFDANHLPENSWTAGHKLADYNNSIIEMMAKLGANIWCPNHKNVTPKLVAEAHAKNIRVVPWTADLKADMTNLIDAGVDGIITNRIDLLRELMSDLKIELPL